MKELSNGQVTNDFLRNLWLQKIPPHIQTVLSAFSEPLYNMANIADKVFEVVGASSPVCSTSSVPHAYDQPFIELLAQQIRDLSLRTSQRHQRRHSCCRECVIFVI
ncbi:hypothetical protein AVEN_105316-1 [Araneus ventricosus]|uniref:Uncharacterized protein n=1 Tax=Araneus ventricosus TaxID=182803 RepID=A0A4Y2N0K6_ARAVE|nr:hypothetical protein AVEN_105316-1 [Araneus ventricosus]